jgi:hypothetical protein
LRGDAPVLRSVQGAGLDCCVLQHTVQYGHWKVCFRNRNPDVIKN